MSHAKTQRHKEDRRGKRLFLGALSFVFFGWYSLCALGVLSGAGVRNGLGGRTHVSRKDAKAQSRPTGERDYFWVLSLLSFLVGILFAILAS
jgi:hypothetical protein